MLSGGRITMVVLNRMATSLSPGKIEKSYRLLSPAARVLLDIYGLKAESVPFSGPRSTLLKSDVLSFIDRNKLSVGAKPEADLQPDQRTPPPPPTKGLSGQRPSRAASRIDVSEQRSASALRVVNAKSSVPHLYANVDCDVTECLTIKRNMSEESEFDLLAFVIRSASKALNDVPSFRSAIWGANTPSSFAIITSTGSVELPRVQALGIDEINKLLSNTTPDASQQPNSARFLVRNLGMYGVTEFSTIIEPPQICILSAGSVRRTVLAGGDASSVMTVTLSADARHVDDFVCAEFLDCFRNHMQEPAT